MDSDQFKGLEKMANIGEDHSRIGSARATPSIARARLAIGLVQGIVAWLLLRLVPPMYYAAGASQMHGPYWASQHPMIFAALALITAYVPVIAIAEIGRMRRRTLTIYLAIASAVIAGLAAYDIWRDPNQLWGGADSSVRVWPSFTVSFCMTLGLFIVNQLLEHRERGNSLFAEYADHFEDSWMRGFQLVLSFIFTLLVWGLLELGAELFHVIHLDWFKTMVEHNWFRCPALAMAFAAAIHITDVRPALLNGVRNVGLTLLSWLLPMVVVLGSAFLVALVFVGVNPLWATGHAASILLWASFITVLLLNAAYKDGDPSGMPPAALRWTGRVAGPIVLLLGLLAFYAIALRVYQYGWTTQRVFSAAVAAMSLVYGGGYTYASIRPGIWLTPIERVNVIASLIIVAILALLLSPVADPARLSINSQLRRLETNEISPSKFDYQFLRFESGRFGTQALAHLAEAGNEDVRSRALLMQAARTRRYRSRSEPDPAVTEPPFSHATVYPKNTNLPEDFKKLDFSSAAGFEFGCLQNGTPCEIYVLGYGAPGDLAIVVNATIERSRPRSLYLPVFQRNREGKWARTGTLSAMGCANFVAALREGNVAPVRSLYDDLLADGIRLHFSPSVSDDTACSKELGSEPADHHGETKDANAPVQMGPAFAKP
ncbi:MAG TPA: DUF4153 domain-containing protein [Steroidobacteraceae bacterium]|jgi:hypothetical protein|nr:DUF4153 domain-containing protein [Steroidobacteraceae bacterium]